MAPILMGDSIIPLPFQMIRGISLRSLIISNIIQPGSFGLTKIEANVKKYSASFLFNGKTAHFYWTTYTYLNKRLTILRRIFWMFSLSGEEISHFLLAMGCLLAMAHLL